MAIQEDDGLAVRDPEIRLVDVWHAILSHRIVLVAAAVLFGMLSVVIAYVSPEIYRAEVLLVAAPSLDGSQSSKLGGAVGNLASLVGGSLPDDAMRQEEALAVLRSRAFTVAFIKDENLLPVLFSKQWDQANARWVADAQPPTESDAYDLFDKEVRRIEEDVKTGLVRLVVEWKDPAEAARWANILVERLNQQMRLRAIEEAENNLGYLRKQAESVNAVELRQAIYRLIEIQLRQSMLATVQKQYVFKVVDPAVPSDIDKFVKPKRLFLVLSGLILGAIIGAIVSVALSRRSLKMRVARST